MKNYDFLILQHNEFECLSRDLLQKKEKVFVESFTIGRDGGIDLRFAKVKDQRTIVQAKRYTTYRELISNLKKEVSKVALLAVDRYVLCTSVGLTPANKETVMQMFSPYIRSTEDILGRDDLNNLLGLYPEVEKQYYKLWLGSTDVLNSLINNRINNWSEFRLERIREDIHKYVMNDSFSKAAEILDKHHCVIISGIPGIGKSTLANMLVYKYLADGYEEFVYIAGDIDDVPQKYQKGRKQIFLFDDFLGSSVFEKGSKGFDAKLINLIEAISKSSDKLFILTTREYILSQAKEEYEKFELANIDINKCTIDFKDYRRGIRAKILYNHLAGTDIPVEYLQELICCRRYNSIVNHKNFNPRIIETIVNQRLWEQVEVDMFYKEMVNMFDNPKSVWEFPFKKLDIFTRYSLVVLRTLGIPVLLDDWKEAFRSFLENNFDLLHLTFDEEKWQKAVKVLSDCFIYTDMIEGAHRVRFHNPSVPEFLENHLKDKAEMQKMLIEGAIYEEQTYTLFGDSHLDSLSGDDLVKACDRCLSAHRTSSLLPSYALTYTSGLRKKPKRAAFLKELATKHHNTLGPRNYVEAALSLDDLKEENMFHVIYPLVSNIDLSKVRIGISDIIECILDSVKILYNYPDMLRFIQMHASIQDYEARIIDDIRECVVGWELDSCKNASGCDALRVEIEEIQNTFLPDSDMDDIYEAIESRKEDLEDGDAESEYERRVLPEMTEDDIKESALEELFTSLLVK